MKLYFSIILICLSCDVIASKFVLVTPENQAEYGLTINAEKIDRNNCLVEFDLVEYSKFHAWLTLSTKPLNEEEQDMRGYLWGGAFSYRAAPTSLILRTKIGITSAFVLRVRYFGDLMSNETVLVPGKHRDEDSFIDSYQIIVPLTNVSHSYLYFDYPQHTFDGGDHFSVDLSGFCVD